MFGKYMPIWVVVLVELCFAYTCEILIGQQFSFKIACKNFDIKKTNLVTFEFLKQNLSKIKIYCIINLVEK